MSVAHFQFILSNFTWARRHEYEVIHSSVPSALLGLLPSEVYLELCSPQAPIPLFRGNGSVRHLFRAFLHPAPSLAFAIHGSVSANGLCLPALFLKEEGTSLYSSGI